MPKESSLPILVSQYFLIARLVPAIICAVPFFVLYFFFLEPILGPFFQAFLKIQWIGDLSTLTAFVLLLVYVGRFISKDIFEGFLFQRDETQMPTTNILLHSGSEYTPLFKSRIHEKIKNDFNIQILSVEAEDDDEQIARRTIVEAVSMIRQKVKDGRLVLQHNIEYGFFRNLIGCAVIAVLISGLNIWISHWITPNTLVFKLSISLLVIYSLPILLSKVLMDAHGNRYARVLIQEYLSL